MRSIRKFIFLSLITLLIPSIVMGIVYVLDLDEIGIFIGQMIILVLFILIFTRLMKIQKDYEAKTMAMVDETRNLGKLREIRENRMTYKSKAYATKKILGLDYSEEELRSLKKYASKPDDMVHYFSAKIDHADKEDREIYKKKRDAYMQRYEKKTRIYPDFKSNLRTAINWAIFFFATALIYNIIPRYFNSWITSWDALAAYILLGMIILALVMVMTILWIIRSLVSYWNKDMF